MVFLFICDLLTIGSNQLMSVIQSGWRHRPSRYVSGSLMLIILFLTLMFVPAAAGMPAANATITDAVAAGSGEQTVVVRFSDPAQLPAGAADAEPVVNGLPPATHMLRSKTPFGSPTRSSSRLIRHRFRCGD